MAAVPEATVRVKPYFTAPSTEPHLQKQRSEIAQSSIDLPTVSSHADAVTAGLWLQHYVI